MMLLNHVRQTTQRLYGIAEPGTSATLIIVIVLLLPVMSKAKTDIAVNVRIGKSKERQLT